MSHVTTWVGTAGQEGTSCLRRVAIKFGQLLQGTKTFYLCELFKCGHATLPILGDHPDGPIFRLGNGRVTRGVSAWLREVLHC